MRAMKTLTLALFIDSAPSPLTSDKGTMYTSRQNAEILVGVTV